MFYFDVENIISKMTQSGCSWITLHVKSRYWRLHHHFWTGLKRNVHFHIQYLRILVTSSFLYIMTKCNKCFLTAAVELIRTSCFDCRTDFVPSVDPLIVQNPNFDYYQFQQMWYKLAYIFFTTFSDENQIH